MIYWMIVITVVIWSMVGGIAGALLIVELRQKLENRRFGRLPDDEERV